MNQKQLNKKKLYKELKEKLNDLPYVIAAWEGGSKATHFDDEYSDLDLAVIVQDEEVETAFLFFEDYLNKNFKINRQFRISEPAWHGFSQAFYLLDDMPKHFYVDFAVIKESIEDKFTDPKRHGDAFVWFDKKMMSEPHIETEEDVLSRAKRFYQRVSNQDFIVMTEVEKNLSRNNYLEAYFAYFQFVYAYLVPLLNLKHRKEKVDFGMRYAYRDYNRDDCILIEKLMKNQNIDDIKNNYHLAKLRFIELKGELSENFR
ncbi:MAG: hypothetical protein JXC31_05260 [Acholeplasmataceae bacterium]|nr:hypothetical protein [Acholeplasmataceae bacterium]